MSLKLSWADLITEDLDPEEAFGLLRRWAWLVPGQVCAGVPL